MAPVLTARQEAAAARQWARVPTGLVAIIDAGRYVTTVADRDVAFTWLLRNQGQSVVYALTWGGYTLVPDPDGEARAAFTTNEEGWESE